MVKFLIKRPIAVTMTFIAILVLGLVASLRIPVSLMPSIDIPQITVQVSGNGLSARELENTVVRSLRNQLMQVSHLSGLNSETRDGTALIYLDFDYGADIDFAFIEVNEKIDRAMGNLPRDLTRPKVIKASATDIPVFYLNISLKTDSAKFAETGKFNPISSQFASLSSFAANVIGKRIEQLPEVAMVDISGRVYPELLIIPDKQKMEAMGISLNTLEEAIRKNDIRLGNLLIHNGQYQYNIRFSSTLKTKRDIENIYLKVEGRLLQMKELVSVNDEIQKRKGLVTSGGSLAITMAIIKQSDARMFDLKKELYSLVDNFRKDYPDLVFHINRDQTRLLDYSLSNLGQSLLYGAILAFAIMFFFLKDYKSPFLVGITIPVSLVISLLLFFLIGLSINIISLSGLILGMGMMIDNSIIVIDNITQYRERGHRLDESCVTATNEVIRPMLSSVLTTCAIFIPLIFLSGMGGALFYDQAMAVAIGMFISLVVSITLLPVYYRLMYLKNPDMESGKLFKRLKWADYGELYETGFRYVMRHQPVIWGIVVLLLIAGGIFFYDMHKSKLPPITRDEVMVHIDWNEPVNLEENNRRIQKMVNSLGGDIKQNTCLIGEQQFLLDYSGGESASEAMIYLKAINPVALSKVQENTGMFLQTQYPKATYQFREAENVFTLLFSGEEPPLVIRLRAMGDFGPETNRFLQQTLEYLRDAFPQQHIPAIPWKNQLVLKTDPVKLLTYDVTFDVVYSALKSAFSSNQILLITQNRSYVPVVLGAEPTLINTILARTTVPNKDGDLIPLRSLLTQSNAWDMKTILAGEGGVYYPVFFNIRSGNVEQVQNKVREVLRKEGHFEADFTGSIFSNRKMMKQLAVILSISLLLLYFILAAQFESLKLPFILLAEIPIDFAGVLLMLAIFKEGINLMSMIGIIVMGGIVINDSILKIDTINHLRARGYSLIHAIAEGGKRRLKPILMTSLTTILALIPFLFSKGLGADLQRPLALAVIGGLGLGTFVSLYFVPLLYYLIEKGKEMPKI